MASNEWEPGGPWPAPRADEESEQTAGGWGAERDWWSDDASGRSNRWARSNWSEAESWEPSVKIERPAFSSLPTAVIKPPHVLAAERQEAERLKSVACNFILKTTEEKTVPSDELELPKLPSDVNGVWFLSKDAPPGPLWGLDTGRDGSWSS